MCILILCGCTESATSSTGVTITMPQDNTVNGYRTKEVLSRGSTASEDIKYNNGLYYANTSSKKFHLSSCKSAEKISDENLYITEFRDELIEHDYTPCSVCSP